MAAEPAQSFIPPSFFEKAFFSAPPLSPIELEHAQPLYIEGVDYSKGLPWNDAVLLPLPQGVKNQALQPRYMRFPDGVVYKILPHKVGEAGKAYLLHQWLQGKRLADGPGNFSEYVAVDMLQVLANRFSAEGDIRIEHAPHPLDRSNKATGDKGADLWLVKDHGDGTSTILSLIDIKTSLPTQMTEKGKTRRRSRRLRSGMNRRLSYPIPVIVVFLGGLDITTIGGNAYKFLDYITGPVFEAASNNEYSELYEIDPLSHEGLFAQIREQIHQACIATKRKVQETAPDKVTLDRFLYQLAFTDKILGIRS